MIGITKESINNAAFEDKQWINPRKNSLIKKLSTEGKIVLYLFGTVAVFTIANVTLIYSFYKILMKL